MEKTFTFLEGFGGAGDGDGFVGQVGELPGALTMTACTIVRIAGYDMINGVLPGGTAMQIAGEIGPVPSGWGFVLRSTDIGSMIDLGNLGTGFDFTNIQKPMGDQTMVLHVCADAADPNATGRAYLNGSLYAEGNIAPVFPANRPTIGVPSVVDATLVPFGGTNAGGAGGEYNGIAGLAYGQFAMSTDDVARHYQQILNAEDVIQGIDASGNPYGFTNLYSAKRGLADLDDDTTVWNDLIGNVNFTRETSALPTLRVRSRRARFF